MVLDRRVDMVPTVVGNTVALLVLLRRSPAIPTSRMLGAGAAGAAAAFCAAFAVELSTTMGALSK